MLRIISMIFAAVMDHVKIVLAVQFTDRLSVQRGGRMYRNGTIDANHVPNTLRHKADVVGNQCNGHRPVQFGQRLEQNFLGRRVDIVRWFVEQQNIRLAAECPGDENPLPLTAGQRAERSVTVFVQLENSQSADGGTAVAATVPKKLRIPTGSNATH